MGIYTDSAEDKKYTENKAESKVKEYNPFDLATIDDLGKDVNKHINKFIEKSRKSGFWGLENSSKPVDLWNFFGDYANGKVSSGLKGYPTPHLSDYKKCVDYDGLSAWDEKGWWRCLFPQAKVLSNNELSKEDVLKDSGNKHGLFFKDYTGFLNWRLQMKQLVDSKQAEQLRLSEEARNIQNVYDEHAKDVNDSYFIDKPEVVSTSESVYFRTLPNGDGEEITQTKKVFKDGTTQDQKFRKLIPKNGSPTIEDLSDKNDDFQNNDNKHRLNWIWNNNK